MRKLPESGPAGTSAVMMVPVKHEQRVVGVVQLMSDQGVYDRHELEVFEALVSQMAAAVRNARLQRERARLEAAEAAAAAVAAEREQAARVLEVVGDGIFLVDDDGVVRLWNRAAELSTGVAAERALARPAADAFRDWDALAQRIAATDDAASARPVTLPVEVEGRDLWLSFVAVRGPTASSMRSATSRASAASTSRRATSSPRSRTSCERRWPPCSALLRRSSSATTCRPSSGGSSSR